MGRTCGLVRGCVFVPVGHGPLLFCFFILIILHYFHCCTTFHCGSVFVPVGDGPDILFLIQTAAAICFSPIYTGRRWHTSFRSTISFLSRKQIDMV